MYVIHQGNSMRSCEQSKGVSSRGERDVRPSSGQDDGGGVFHLRRVNQATYHSFGSRHLDGRSQSLQG